MPPPRSCFSERASWAPRRQLSPVTIATRPSPERALACETMPSMPTTGTGARRSRNSSSASAQPWALASTTSLGARSATSSSASRASRSRTTVDRRLAYGAKAWSASSTTSSLGSDLVMASQTERAPNPEARTAIGASAVYRQLRGRDLAGS